MEFERAGRVHVDLSPKNPFGLTFPAPDKNRSLYIEEPKNFGVGTSQSSQDLTRTVMLAHLVIRHFPAVIETNFKVDHTIFLNEVYKHYGFSPPKIVKSKDQVEPIFMESKEDKTEKILYANAHSGGLDSVYRAALLLSQNKKVLIAHLRNLNPKGNYREAVASREQAQSFGLPYEEIRLRNGTDNTGFSAMRTRDMFLALAVAMASAPYGSTKVFIEGDMQVGPKSHFSEYKPAWEFFNKLMKDSGLNSQAEGIDAHDIETIGEVIKLEKNLGIDIIPLVQNCFTAPYQMGNNRGKWERETPAIFENSSDHWCGSCIKCRRMTLGRIYYHDPRFAKVPKREIKYFVNDTYKWLEEYPNNSDLISESFLRHLGNLGTNSF
ncbi:MAG: hypothetical protein HYV90_00810 [Candidatus Woesebacteria bacterium]|nr:MAG: hypothetical protein HYV90_00810 [Candidatus Woesebacteria bacterium]